MRFYEKVAQSNGPEALLSQVLPDLETTASYDLRGEWSGMAPGCGLPGMYVVERGTLCVAPGSRRCELMAGDVLLMPAAMTHRVGNRWHEQAEPMTALLEQAREVDGWARVGEGDSVQLHTVLLEPRPLPRLDRLPAWLPLARTDQSQRLRSVVDALRNALEPGAAHPEVAGLLTRALWLEALQPAFAGARLDLAMLELAERAQERIETLEHVDQLARLAGLSRSRLHERFQACHGVTPMAWLRTQRMRHARHLLDQQGFSVARVAERLGYASESAFRKAYKRTLGIPARAR